MSETTTPYDHEEEMKYRDKGIGGSDVASVLGISKWKSPIQLWMEKTGRSPKQPDNNTFKRGRALEPVVLEEYTTQTGRPLIQIAPVIDGCFIASLDAMTADRKRIVDAKTTTRGYTEIPMYYETQLQWYMGFFPEAEYGDLPTWDLLNDEIDCDLSCVRNDELIAGMRAIVKEFWKRYVEGDTPPPPQTEDDCKLIWSKQTSGKIVIATPVEIASISRLNRIKSLSKRMEAAESEAKFAIMRRIEDADTLTDEAGNKLCTFRANKDSKKIDWEAVAKELNAPEETIAKHTTTTSGSRVLRLAK